MFKCHIVGIYIYFDLIYLYIYFFIQILSYIYTIHMTCMSIYHIIFRVLNSLIEGRGRVDGRGYEVREIDQKISEPDI